MDKKPCFYCGSNNLEIAEVHDPNRTPVKQKYVQCKVCGACGPLAEKGEWAILKWNSRIQEESEMPQERPLITTWMEAENAYCPLNKAACRNCLCMMWLRIGENKGRCGLVNTMYINSTGCMILK